METQRKLPYEPDKKVLIQYDFDFYSCVWYEGENMETPVYFLKNQQTGEFEKLIYTRWYMSIALEKLSRLDASEKLLITKELVYGFWYAIREGYNHMLDPALRNPYDCPRIRNTLSAVRAYIKRIADKNNHYE